MPMTKVQCRVVMGRICAPTPECLRRCWASCSEEQESVDCRSRDVGLGVDNTTRRVSTTRRVDMSATSLPPFQTRDLPEPPARLWPLIGPGVVAAGVGLASGEFILWPYIASHVGLVLLWG